MKELTVETIEEFIKTHLRESGASGGWSAFRGIDSAVVTKLARTHRGDKVLNVFLPYPSTPKQDLRTSRRSKAWGTTLLIYDIEQL